MQHSGTPDGVPLAYDCAIRESAWRYGRARLKARGDFQSLFDALQLSACNLSRPLVRDSWRPPADTLPVVRHERAPEVFVLLVEPSGAARSSDAGTFSSLHEALDSSRQLRRRRNLAPGTPITIALRAGTHYLAKTLTLFARDSGTTIRNYPGEVAVLSGGLPLGPLQWRRSRRCANPKASGACRRHWEAELSADSPPARFDGLRLNGNRQIRARYPNADPEV